MKGGSSVEASEELNTKKYLPSNKVEEDNNFFLPMHPTLIMPPPPSGILACMKPLQLMTIS